MTTRWFPAMAAACLCFNSAAWARTETLALDGDMLPNGGVIEAIYESSINESGQVLFLATTDLGASYVLQHETARQVMVSTGDNAPVTGDPLNGLISGILNNLGNVIFAEDEYPTAQNGIYLATGGGLQLVAHAGDVVVKGVGSQRGLVVKGVW